MKFSKTKKYKLPYNNIVYKYECHDKNNIIMREIVTGEIFVFTIEEASTFKEQLPEVDSRINTLLNSMENERGGIRYVEKFQKHMKKLNLKFTDKEEL